jgi:benzoate/toluate 1,2-dioxygenase beta subunit
MSEAAAVETLAAVSAFLLKEARLLDERQFGAWAALFAADGLYWVPARPGQEDGLEAVSLFYDDRDGLAARIRRLAHPAMHAGEPPPRTVHLVSNVEIVGAREGVIDVASALLMAEYRLERQRLFAARCHHRLRREGAGEFRIAQKRVDLVNCDATFDALAIPF